MNIPLQSSQKSDNASVQRKRPENGSSPPENQAALEASRRMTEEHMRASQRSLANAQRIAHVGNWDWNVKTNELRWSDEIYRIFGLTPQQFGATYEAFLDSVHPEDRAFVRKSVDDALRVRAPFSIDHRIILPNGAKKFVHEQAEVTFDAAGQPVQMSGTVQDITERMLTEAKLRASQAQLRSLTVQLEFAETRERRRIAADIHDRIGQSLAFAKMKLDQMHASATSTDSARELEELRGLIEQIIVDSRSLIFELSPPVLHELGLLPALKWLAEQMLEQHDVCVHVRTDGSGGPTDQDERAILFKAVRELLFNVAKHSKARRAEVSLQAEGNSLKLIVADDGIGFDVSKTRNVTVQGNGFGLFSLHERLLYLGGSLEVDSSPGRGTRITILFPFKEQPQ